MTDADGPKNPIDPQDDQPTTVSRASTRNAKAEANQRRNLLLAGGLVAVLLIGAVTALLVGGSKKSKTVETVASTTTSSSTSTTTSVPPVDAPTMPLTGVALDPGDEAAVGRLNRPALAVKIDNDPAAMPQVGLDKADLVVELRVEGISRYLAVFHSQDVGEVGPVRSARTSDPDILAMFGHPVFAWSGGNKNVTRIIRDTPWIQNLSHGQLPSAYRRTKTKKPPHNLIADASELFGHADEPPAVPPPLFGYLASGQDPGGLPTLGFELHVGKSQLAFRWDADAAGWRRWSNGRRHMTSDDQQITAANVVVAQTGYRRSDADSRSPEAVSVGGGAVWVFTQGRVLSGTWQRDAREQPWRLTGSDGQPILLSPGSTWVEMPDSDVSPRFLDEGSVTRLLSS